MTYPHQFRCRAAVYARPARPQMPTSTTKTLSVKPYSVDLPRHARTSTRALLCGLAQEGASHTTKIGNGILRKVDYGFFNPPTATIASSHHHLPTSPCSSLHPALIGAAVNMRQVQPRASSSAFSACVSTYPADPKPLLWCTSSHGVSFVVPCSRVK